MAGLRGSVAYFAAAKQSAKGATPTTAKHAWAFAGGNIGPKRTIQRIQETDTTRDAGDSYVSEMHVEGAPELYVRDNSVDFWFAAAQGAVADSGTTNYTHTITNSNTLPYIYMWRMLGDTLWQSFQDCVVDQLTFKVDAGGTATITPSVMGLTATRLTADPISGWTTPGNAIDAGAVYTYNDAAVTLATASTSSISSFELTINNNLALQQTDDVTPYDISTGGREISGSFDLIFENLTEYNKFITGSGTGTAPSSTLYTTDLSFVFTKGTNNSLTISLPKIAYEEFEPEPKPDGSPVTVPVRFGTQRNSGNSNLTTTVKNQKATTF